MGQPAISCDRICQPAIFHAMCCFGPSLSDHCFGSLCVRPCVRCRCHQCSLLFLVPVPSVLPLVLGCPCYQCSLLLGRSLSREGCCFGPSLSDHCFGSLWVRPCFGAYAISVTSSEEFGLLLAFVVASSSSYTAEKFF